MSRATDVFHVQRPDYIMKHFKNRGLSFIPDGPYNCVGRSSVYRLENTGFY